MTSRVFPKSAGTEAAHGFTDTGETLFKPQQVGGKWVVRVEDTILGASESRSFSYAKDAWDFYTTIVMARQGGLDEVGTERHSKAPVDANNHLHTLATSEQLDRRAGSRSGGVNLRKVAETLADYGLDPAEELAGVLAPRILVNDDGTQELGYALGHSERAKALLDLMQYMHPKLKAIEVTQKVDELTEAQVDAKLAALVAKAQKRKAAE